MSPLAAMSAYKWVFQSCGNIYWQMLRSITKASALVETEKESGT